VRKARNPHHFAYQKLSKTSAWLFHAPMVPKKLAHLWMTGWWLTYPSEKWLVVTIPNIWKNKCSKPPTT
jgi:hypothetical protein